MDPAWQDLKSEYDFLLRFSALLKANAMLAKRYIDRSFILRLLDLTLTILEKGSTWK